MGKPEWKATMQPQGLDKRLNTSETLTTASDLSFLMGILAEIPTLFLQCDEYVRLQGQNSFLTPPAHVATFCTRIGQLQKELEGWEEQWMCTYADEMYETLPITKVESTQGPAWRTVFHFNSVKLAVTFAMYHSVIILLMSIPAALLQAGLIDRSYSIFNDSDSHIGHPTQSLLAGVQKSIHSICRSIEYHLQFQQRSQMPADFYLFFPIHVARRACVQLRLSPELTWLTDASEAIKINYPMGVWANMDFGDRFSGLEEGLFG